MYNRAARPKCCKTVQLTWLQTSEAAEWERSAEGNERRRALAAARTREARGAAPCVARKTADAAEVAVRAPAAYAGLQA